MRTLRSLLFMPGNNPGMLISGDVLGADALIFDLEDAVSLDEKDAARALVVEALSTLERRHCLVSVRINPLDSPFWQDDLLAVLPAAPDALVVPKATPEALREVIIFCDEKKLTLPTIWPLLESPLAIVSLPQFSIIDLDISALLLGGEDYAAALGVARTSDSLELLYARTALVTHAKANGWQAIDTPFTDTTDIEGLTSHVESSKTIGFDGVLAIHPAQVDVIRAVYLPSEEERLWAEAVLKLAEEAKAASSGVFSYGGKMVDRPILLRAEKIMEAVGGGSDA